MAIKSKYRCEIYLGSQKKVVAKNIFPVIQSKRKVNYLIQITSIKTLLN